MSPGSSAQSLSPMRALTETRMRTQSNTCAKDSSSAVGRPRNPAPRPFSYDRARGTAQVQIDLVISQLGQLVRRPYERRRVVCHDLRHYVGRVVLGLHVAHFAAGQTAVVVGRYKGRKVFVHTAEHRPMRVAVYVSGKSLHRGEIVLHVVHLPTRRIVSERTSKAVESKAGGSAFHLNKVL